VKDIDEHTARVLRDHLERDEHDPNARIQPKRSNGHASTAAAKPGHNQPLLTAIPAWEFGKRPLRPHVIKGEVNEGAMCMTFGKPESGKTAIELLRCLHIIQGWEWFGKQVQQGAAIWFAAEDSRGIEERWMALCDHHEVDRVGQPFILIDEPLDLLSSPADAIKMRRTMDHLEETLDVRFLWGVIDPISGVLPGGDTSGSQAYGAFLRHCRDYFKRDHPIALTGINHESIKGTGNETYLGNTNLKGGLDNEWRVSLSENGSGRLEVKKNRAYRHGATTGFHLESGKVWDALEDEYRSIPVACLDDAAPPDDVKVTRWAKIPKSAPIAANALRQAVKDLGRAPPGSVGAPPGTKAVKIEDWRGMAYRHGISTGVERAKQKAFQKGREYLEKDRQVTISTCGWCWFRE